MNLSERERNFKQGDKSHNRLEMKLTRESTPSPIISTSTTLLGREDKNRIAVARTIGLRESNSKGIVLAIQKLSDKLQNLRRERDAAVRSLEAKMLIRRRTTDDVKNQVDEAQLECDLIEENLKNILRACNDVISISLKSSDTFEIKKRNAKTVDTSSSKSSDNSGWRKFDQNHSALQTEINYSPPENVCMMEKLNSPRTIAQLQMLTAILKMGRPQLDTEVGHSFEVTHHILYIVLHYLREAVMTLRYIVGHLTVEWVEMSRAIKINKDKKEISSLHERIRIVKLRRENLTLSVHRLETIKRKVFCLIRANREKLAKTETTMLDKGKEIRTPSGQKRSVADSHKGRILNHETRIKFDSGQELLKCLQQLQGIISRL